MPASGSSSLSVAPDWQPALRAAGIASAEDLFTSDAVRVWRSLPERHNGTLDLADGRRLHVKRYITPHGTHEAAQEVRGFDLLRERGIPAADLVASGTLPDGRAVTLTADLAGYVSCQQLLRAGRPFDLVAGPTSRLAAQLHRAGLHHQDLYLCHFFLRESDGDVRLIDVSRVGRLPRFLAKRWVVKDLGQFWYSAAGEFAVPETRLTAWLDAYAAHRDLRADALLGPVKAKSARIAAHDARLKLRQPTRNISIPGAGTEVAR